MKSSLRKYGHIPYKLYGGEDAVKQVELKKQFLRHIESYVMRGFSYIFEDDMLFIGPFGHRPTNFRLYPKHFEAFAEELEAFASSDKQSAFTEVFADVTYFKEKNNIIIQSREHGSMQLPKNKVDRFIKEATEIMEQWS